MAVPTITRILPAGEPVGTPAEGPTAGRSLVEIYGSGFRLPPAPAAGAQAPSRAGIVHAEEPRTVAVTFGGEAAADVRVVRSNLLRVMTPISPLPVDASNSGEGSVDVVVQNLDDYGDAIPGESVTLPDGYTYRRARLDATQPSNLVAVVSALVVAFRRQVLRETVLTTHTDFDPDVSTALVEVAELPAVVVTGPALRENRFYSRNGYAAEDVGGDRVDVRRQHRTVDLLFDVIGISDATAEVMNLLEVVAAFMERNPYLEVLRDPADPSKGTVRYELDYQEGGDFRIGARPSESNVRFFSGSIVVRGFDVGGGFTGFTADILEDLTTTLQEDPDVTTGLTSEEPAEAVYVVTDEGDGVLTDDGHRWVAG